MYTLNGNFLQTKTYTISSDKIYPVIFGANQYDANNSDRKSPVSCVVFPNDDRKQKTRNPLLSILFSNNNSEMDFKIIQSIDGIPMETIDSDSDTIFPQGKTNKQELRFARFTGMSDEVDIDTMKDHYWHDLLCTDAGTLILVGNGVNNIIRSTNSGQSWNKASTQIKNDCCIYQIRQFGNTLIAVGEEWTEPEPGYNYYIDSEGNLFWADDPTMFKEFNKSIYESHFVVFTPTKHNGNCIALRSNDDGNTWQKINIPQINQIRSILISNDKIIIIPGNGELPIYSKDSVTWEILDSLPGTNRNYVGCYGNGIYILLSIDNPEEFYYSSDGVVWNSKEISTKASWYACEYIPDYVDPQGNIKGVFLVASVNGYVGFIDSDTLEYTQLYYKDDTHWYDIKYGENYTMVIGGCGDLKRILVSPNKYLTNWVLKKSSKYAWHNITYMEKAKTFVVISYDGNDGGVGYIDYLSDLDKDILVSINTRLYSPAGKEIYNLPEDYIIPQENYFDAILFTNKLGEITKERFNRGSIIYGENYNELIKHLYEVIASYVNSPLLKDSGIKNNPFEVFNNHTSLPKDTIDFIGTYGRSVSNVPKTFTDFLNYCYSILITQFNKVLEVAETNSLIDSSNIPQVLKPIYGEKGLFTHNWKPGELVYKDGTEVENEVDQMMLGLMSIIDLLSMR